MVSCDWHVQIWTAEAAHGIAESVENILVFGIEPEAIRMRRLNTAAPELEIGGCCVEVMLY